MSDFHLAHVERGSNEAGLVRSRVRRLSSSIADGRVGNLLGYDMLDELADMAGVTFGRPVDNQHVHFEPLSDRLSAVPN